MVRNLALWNLLTTNLGFKRAIFRDESVYPNAHDFNPDRFLKDGKINPDVKDPEQLAFGYGRRYLHFQWMSVLHSSKTCEISIGSALGNTSLCESSS